MDRKKSTHRVPSMRLLLADTSKTTMCPVTISGDQSCTFAISPIRSSARFGTVPAMFFRSDFWLIPSLILPLAGHATSPALDSADAGIRNFLGRACKAAARQLLYAAIGEHVQALRRRAAFLNYGQALEIVNCVLQGDRCPNRFNASSRYAGSISIPRLFRPVLRAAICVEAVPVNGSSTVSPTKLNVRTRRSANCTGNGAGCFWVEAPGVSFTICRNHRSWSSAAIGLRRRAAGLGRR